MIHTADPDQIVVRVWVRRPADCAYVPAIVTLREAWILGQPGLIPPPGHQKRD